VAEAREVWFVNEPIRAWHAREYPEHADRLHVVENGWDEGLAPAQHMRPAPTGALTFGYIGTVSAKVPLAEFVEGWTLARERDADVAASRAVIRGYLGFYAAPGRTQVETLEQAEAVGVEFGGPVEKVDVASVYDGFDVLLLILGSGRYVTSGKVYEYLSTGLPVVSVHDPGNAATDVLRGYPLWFPAASLAPEDIADALVAAAAAARDVDEATRAEALEFGARFRRDLQLVPRVHAVLGTDAEGTR
jgi:glycosyltransferase involved in cell wall biosynthesis